MGFVVCFGSMMGLCGLLIMVIVMKIFWGKWVGIIFGIILIGSGFGLVFGFWSGGVIYDVMYGYDLLLFFVFVSVVFGMIFFLIVFVLCE